MSQNITLLGASYSAVPAVRLPKTGGGTADFTDVSDTTAAAADVASGKYFYTSAGVRTQGTSSGGGGDIFEVTMADNGTGVWAPDCTFAEWIAAYNGGKSIFIHDSYDTCDWGWMDVHQDSYLRFYINEDFEDSSGSGKQQDSYSFHSDNTVSYDGLYKFYNATYMNAEPADVAQGKWFINSTGEHQGTASGGGGGLTYETGIFEPESDIARPQIKWTNTHTEAPVLIYMCDVTGTAHGTTNSNYVFAYCDPFKLWGQGYPYSSTGFRYANAYYAYRGTNTNNISANGLLITYKSDSTSSGSTSYPRYWTTETDFHPYSNSTSRYWRAGRTFKWIAVWKP